MSTLMLSASERKLIELPTRKEEVNSRHLSITKSSTIIQGLV
jgi:hypothetical protein